MKAYLLNEVGGAENLVLSDIDKPEVKAGEVLVETKAISINPVDYKARAIEGLLSMLMGEERPVILGWDIAGVVAEVGEDVTDFADGDKVFGMVNFPGLGNAYAEQVAAPAVHLTKMPKGVSFEDAAATTLAALTALQVLTGRVKSGDRVLIHAGSGGVGHFAIQIAKQMGAHVITTSSAKNKDFCMALGADEHIDYREQQFEDVLTDIDFVLDGMGGETLTKSVKVLKNGGGAVSLPAPDFPEEVTAEAEARNLNVEFILVQSNGDDMKQLAGMLENGTLKPHVSVTFPFDKLQDAHLQVESGRTIGKAVVTV
ncbi:NADP-dependent oxidoreductase [Pontiellaceae bacterium B12227]|nr:NADP-dependent oxidoreductase [Pontiellaceae bacterium B12227]